MLTPPYALGGRCRPVKSNSLTETARSSQQNAQPPALAELPGGSPPRKLPAVPRMNPDDPDWSG